MNDYHISVVDREGNVAAMTTSNGEGSGYWWGTQGEAVIRCLDRDVELDPGLKRTLAAAASRPGAACVAGG